MKNQNAMTLKQINCVSANGKFCTREDMRRNTFDISPLCHYVLHQHCGKKVKIDINRGNVLEFANEEIKATGYGTGSDGVE